MGQFLVTILDFRAMLKHVGGRQERAAEKKESHIDEDTNVPLCAFAVMKINKLASLEAMLVLKLCPATKSQMGCED